MTQLRKLYTSSRLLWLGLGILLAALVLQTNYLVNAQGAYSGISSRNRFAPSYVIDKKDEKCGDDVKIVKMPNLPPLYVATSKVPVAEKDIKELVASAIVEQGPCECKCSCTSTPEPVCTATTSYIAKCPCPTPTATTTSTCYTDHFFPQDVRDILRALHITACVPPQVPPCDCGKFHTCD